MARPRKYTSDEQRQEAVREAKRRYNQSSRSKLLRLPKLKHLRKDQKVIVEQLGDTDWDVSHLSQAKFHAALLLPEIANWTIGSTVPGAEVMFVINKEFDLAFRNVDDIHTKPWVIKCFQLFHTTSFEQIDSHLSEISSDTMASIGAGYLCARMYNLFVNIYSNLSEDNNSTAEALRITYKLLARLTELSHVLNAANGPQGNKRDWGTVVNSTGSRRFHRLAQVVLYFSMQEAAIIRFDLWIRYRVSLYGLLAYHNMRYLAWQISWPRKFLGYAMKLANASGTVNRLQNPGAEPHPDFITKVNETCH